MSEPFDAYRYIGYLRSRWRWIAASALLAAGLIIGSVALVITVQQSKSKPMPVDAALARAD